MTTNKKKIIFEIPEQDHKIIKLRATEQNMSMKEWILQALADKLEKERNLGWD